MNAGLLQFSLKCMNITITVFYIDLTKLVLCLMHGLVLPWLCNTMACELFIYIMAGNLNHIAM